MLRIIGRVREFVESVLKKKMKAAVGRICRNVRVYAWNERAEGVLKYSNKYKCYQHNNCKKILVSRIALTTCYKLA